MKGFFKSQLTISLKKHYDFSNNSLNNRFPLIGKNTLIFLQTGNGKITKVSTRTLDFL